MFGVVFQVPVGAFFASIGTAASMRVFRPETFYVFGAVKRSS